MREEHRFYIIQAKTADNKRKTYSVSATNADEALAIFNDFKDAVDESGLIIRELSAAEYREYKRE